MGGRGASSSSGGVAGKLLNLKGSNKEETKFIQQVAKDFELMPNSDVQAEVEAFVMSKIGAKDPRAVSKESDRILQIARQQQDINYVNNLKISNPKIEKTTWKGKEYTTYKYTTTDKDGKKETYDYKKKQKKSSIRKDILDNMYDLPF